MLRRSFLQGSVMGSFKWYGLRWVACWGEFLSGLVGVATFGCWIPAWCLTTDNWFLSCAEKELFNRRTKGDEAMTPRRSLTPLLKDAEEIPCCEDHSCEAP